MDQLLHLYKTRKAYIVVGIIFTLVIALLVLGNQKDLLSFMLATIIIFYSYFYSKYTTLVKNLKDKRKEISIYRNLMNEKSYCMHLDENFNITYINSKIKDFLNIDSDEKMGTSIFRLLTLEEQPFISKVIQKDGTYFADVLYKKGKENITLEVEIKKAPPRSAQNYYVLITGFEEELKTPTQVREEVLRDSLTNLPTRLKLFADIEEIKEQSLFNRITLMYISIDNFDELSEFFGMDAGNIILKRTAEWLEDDKPYKDAKLYKIDFNHFAMMIPMALKKEHLEKYLHRIIVNLAKEQFTFFESSFNIEITVGVAIGSDELVKNAYFALKEAEKSKKSYRIYDRKGDHDKKFLHNIQINKMVKEAIEDGRIEPFFQAIYNTHTNKVEKYESLMRIKKEDNTYARPAEFLDIAKKSKMYTELSREMIKKCFEQLHNVQHPITINISMEDMLDHRVSSLIVRNLERHQFGKFITFEILEDEDIGGEIKVKNFIKKVKSYGCKIAIDDFGSGFSNFAQLRELKVDYIKIDGSLIKNIDKNKESEIMTKSIISMAKDLNIETVAEFVSSKAIYDKVKALGVDYVQGYFIDKADPVLLKNG